MEQTTKLGTNKTGIDMSPIHSKQMIEASENLSMTLGDDDTALESFEKFYLEDADPLGTVPMPGTIKGVIKSAMKMVSGHHPEVFINKLGERLAYERSGVRIYEQLIAKCTYAMANDMAEFQIPLDRLSEFRAQEAEHFELLTNCIKILGADPTAQTPDADASAVGSSGLIKVITDPRTSVSQSLQAMLAIELTDNAAWELLIKLAKDMGLSDMAQEFQWALNQENVHLEQVREWYEESIRHQAKMSMS